MRFYVSPEYIFPEKKIIEIRDRKELHHIRDVMRIEKGMNVHIFDGRGKEYSGSIKEINRNLIVIDIEKCVALTIHRAFKVTLYQAIPKKGKMDFIVEKAVEMGVDTIVPIVTEHTEAAFDKEKGSLKIERLRRISISASKQCGRVNLPVILDIADFEDALSDSKSMDLVIFAALDKEAKPLQEILKVSNPMNIGVFIGPEGDFSENEIGMAKEYGYSICSLGQLVLRVETAGIYILGCLDYELNYKFQIPNSK